MKCRGENTMAIQSNQELYTRLWNGAEQLRGSMEAAKYKDYMLGIMFYKFLSDKTLQAFSETAEIDENVYETYIGYASDTEVMKEVYKALIEDLGYYVQPNDLYQTWLKNIANNTFEVASIENAISNFQRNVQQSINRHDFDGLFSSLDVNSPDLGSDLNKRNKNLRSLIKLFADLDMTELQKSDVLGDAYEYLVGQFGMESGKKAGEFYTPRQVSEVMAQVITNSTNNIRSIYDPAVGSGSLLLTLARHLTNADKKILQYFGQEYNTATYNLTRMNLLLHGVQPDHMTINNGDTLRDDWPEDPNNPQQSRQFDAVVMNPPYSYNWSQGTDSAYSEASLTDPRFQDYEALAPKTKADFAFLLHGLYHLDQNGAMAIVLPHGVLFRGGDEETIRKNLLKKNQIHAIIGMPSSLFTNTGIPVVVIILKKNRVLNGEKDVLIIDASDGFVKDGKQNRLRERDIAKIVDTVSERKEVPGFSHLATLKEIEENEFNLNIPRYVEKIEHEEVQDVEGHLKGGIPKYAIDNLTVLNKLCGEELNNSFNEIRPGYVKQAVDNDELRNRIFKSTKLEAEKKTYTAAISSFEERWFNKLAQVDAAKNIEDLKTEMADEAKQQLSIDGIVDPYSSYQVIANLWNDNLTIDIELIQKYGLITAGRALKQLYKTKKKNNQSIQVEDGQEGSLLSKKLVQQHLFADDLSHLQEVQNSVENAQSEMEQLIEDGKSNDDFDGLIFSEGELLSKKDQVKVKDLDKTADADAIEWLNSYADKEKERKIENKKLSELTDSLDKKTFSIYENLSEQQITDMLRIKWFDSFRDDIINLLSNKIDAELNDLKNLADRYDETLADIQAEKKKIEDEFMELAAQLVEGDPNGR